MRLWADRLIVTVTVNGEKLDLGFSFIDRGGEGYIDEVVLDLVEVDDEVQVLPAEISVLVNSREQYVTRMLRRPLFLILLVPQRKRNGINTWSVRLSFFKELIMDKTILL